MRRCRFLCCPWLLGVSFDCRVSVCRAPGRACADWVHRAPRTRAAVPAPNAGGVARSAVGATVGASAQYECAAPRGAGALPLGRVAGVRGGVGRVRTYRT